MSGILYTNEIRYARYQSGHIKRFLKGTTRSKLLTFEEWHNRNNKRLQKWREGRKVKYNRSRRSKLLIDEDNRKCKKCLLIQSASEFTIRGYTCYKCRRDVQNKCYNKNRKEKYKFQKNYIDNHKRSSTKWRKENPDRVRIHQKKQRDKPDYNQRHRIRAAEWRKKNPEKRKEQYKRSYQRRKEKISEYRKKQRAENPEFFKERDHRYYLAKKFRVSSSTEKSNAL